MGAFYQYLAFTVGLVSTFFKRGWHKSYKTKFIENGNCDIPFTSYVQAAEAVPPCRLI